MATITVRGGVHVLNYTDPQEGRKHTPLGKVGTLSDRQLKDILRIKEYELSTGARLLNAHRRPAPRFEDFARDYLIWHAAEYPDSHYRISQIVCDHLIPHFGITPLNLITVQQGEDYKTKRRFVTKAWTLTKEVRTVHAVLNRAVDTKVISENPITAVKAPKILDSKPHVWYQTDELAELYKASAYGPTWKLLANTGFRRGESLIFRWMWALPKTIRIISTGEERTKSGEWREIPRSTGATAALAALEQRGPYVLPRMAKESLSRACARDLLRVGLPGSLHSLRHSYICHLLINDVPMRTVQLYAGHASITTTEGYAYQVLRQDPAKAVNLDV